MRLDRGGPNRGAFLAAVAGCAAALAGAARALAAGSGATALQPDAAGVHRALLRALVAFDDPAFPLPFDHFDARVTALFHPLDDPQYVAALRTFDRAAGGGFAALSLERSRTLVGAWFDADDDARRRFVASVKNVAMIAAYSDPAMWPAIGYEGPFEQRLR